MMFAKGLLRRGYGLARTGDGESVQHRAPGIPALWLVASFYVIAYVLLDGLDDIQPVLKLGIAPWNPQAGLTLAFLIYYGPARAWLTAIAVVLAAALTSGTTLSWGGMLVPVTLIPGGYAAAAWLLRPQPGSWTHRLPLDAPIDSSRYVFRLIGVGVGVALLVSAGLTWPFEAAPHWPADAMLQGFSQRWIGDLNGVLTVTPLLLAAPHWRSALAAIARRRREVLAQALVVVAALALLVWLWMDVKLRVLYPMFAPMVWIAFRWGVAATAFYTLVSEIGLLMALRGEAPTLAGPQLLLLTLAATGLLLASVVAERRASEVRLRERDKALARAMRFAALGEFASAITHELNQPITALVSYLRSAQILAEPLAGRDPRLLGTLNKAAQEAIRTSDILRGLRDFYQGAPPQLAVVRLEDITASALSGHEERLRQHGVRLHDTLRPGLPPLSCDRTQLEMVVHNLLTNALDAVVAGGGARREIHIGAVRAGSDVLLTVEDSGQGVSSEITAQLFNPFVTTKADGMGLGLAISRSLLRSQGGDLLAERSMLGGARFVVRLPMAAAAQLAP